jgi:hypothetical protein
MGKNKVSQKTIVVIIIIMLMSVTLSVSSLAWEGYPDTGYEETYPMFIATEKTTGNIYAGRTIYAGKNDSFFCLYDYGDGEGNKIRVYSPYTTIKWEGLRMYKWLPDIQEWGEQEKRDNYLFGQILQSNVDIYSDKDKTSVFFSLETLSPLRRVLTQHPPLTLMTPLMRGIIPYLIGLLIALVGFWKAWQFLFKTLRKA